MSTWHSGRPRQPGLYAVRGTSSAERQLAKAGFPVGPMRQRLLGIVMCTVGPRGGERPLRWLEPYRRQVPWEQHWEWCPVSDVDWEREVRFRPKRGDS